ncbi:MAG: LptF/LptG family permease [Verrucomicrobiae bacterium]|jgi:lipopolysaccharide export system permease protein|nr:LptF/LptG family permease [Verrucomicrobiae bacterium]
MRLLDRYLLKELLLPVVYAFGGFFLFIVAFDLFNELPRWQQKGLSGLEIARLYVYRTPQMLPEVLPVAVLLGMLYALAQHSRHNELVAIRAAGVNVWRLAAPYLGTGVLFSLLLFASNEFLMPRGERAADAMLNRTTESQWSTGISFRNEGESRSWNIGAFNTITFSMRQIDVGWSDDYGRNHRMFAQSGRRDGDVWRFENVELHEPDAANPGFPLKIITNSVSMPGFTETPELIASEIKISSMSSARLAKKVRFSLEEIGNYLKLHPDLAGGRAAELRTQLHGRLAMPWTCLVVVLLALPFGFKPGRSNAMVSIGLAIGVAFAFFFVSRLSLALGTGGHLPGWIAGWLPCLLFGGTGFHLVRRNA